jgi:MlaD protein
MKSKPLGVKVMRIAHASKRIMLLVVFAALASCGNNGDEFTALIPSDSGISEHAPVLLNGFEVGHLKELRIQPAEKAKVYATIVLHPNRHLAKDSHFEVCNAGLITDSKYVAVRNTNGTPYLSLADTIAVELCTEEKRELIDSTSVLLIDSFIRHTRRLMHGKSVKQRVEPKEPLKAH